MSDVSIRVEWVSAKSTTVEPITDPGEFSDAFGTQLDPGEVGVFVGEGVVIYGTRPELISWAAAFMSAAHQATPYREKEE